MISFFFFFKIISLGKKGCFFFFLTVILSVLYAFQTTEIKFGNNMDISTIVYICRCGGCYPTVKNLILQLLQYWLL